MPVRIYFRGLILFRFPKDKDGAVKLLAELISEPRGRRPPRGAAAGQDDHQPEIQVATGDDFRDLLSESNKTVSGSTKGPRAKLSAKAKAAQQVRRAALAFQKAASASFPTGLNNSRQLLLLPRRLEPGMNVDISVSGRASGVKRSRSFSDHVPSIDRLAMMAGLPGYRGKGKNPDDKYVRNTITVDCGTISVSQVFTWDTGYSMDELSPEDRPSSPAEVRFMGVDFRGHAATECVLDVPHDKVTIEVTDSHGTTVHQARYTSPGTRNQLAPENATEIMIQNYEYQRTQPVPWGMDFQWLFERLGYGKVDLRPDLDLFRALPRDTQLEALFKADNSSFFTTNRKKHSNGRPFPYIMSNVALTRLTPLTGTKSRPLCVQGTTP